MLAAPGVYESDALLQSNDSDAENEDDQTPDPSEVLGMVVSSLVLLLLGGKLLLACYEETNVLSSIYCLALDQPG
jgi:hypothetical protein